MTAYRFYFLDSAGHVAGPPDIVECADDRAAIEAAKALVNGKAIEVWEMARIVIRLEPKRPER
jgi:hypothetical protein